MPPIRDVVTKMTLMEIGPYKCIATIRDVNSQVITREVPSLYYTPDAGEELIGINKQITFMTPTGMLSDWEYAVQANTFIWVKAPGYQLIKIPAEYVDLDKNSITVPGIQFLKLNSALE